MAEVYFDATLSGFSLKRLDFTHFFVVQNAEETGWTKHDNHQDLMGEASVSTEATSLKVLGNCSHLWNSEVSCILPSVNQSHKVEVQKFALLLISEFATLYSIRECYRPSVRWSVAPERGSFLAEN